MAERRPTDMLSPLAREPIMRWPEFERFVRDKPEEERWELIDGAAVMQATPNEPHQVIVANLLAGCREAIGRRDLPCRAMPGLTVKVEHVDTYAAVPDVMVRCGPPKQNWKIDDPLLVAEVVSPSSVTRDAGFKLEFYRVIAALRAYLIVHTDERRVEIWQRGTDEEWVKSVLDPARPTARVACLDMTLTLDGVYEGVA